jgi:small-conductance mechanosensitive channel
MPIRQDRWLGDPHRADAWHTASMIQWIAEQLDVEPTTVTKVVSTVVAVAVVLVVRWIVLRALRTRFQEEWDEYRAHKVASYTATLVIVVTVAWIWIDAFDDLPTFLGLISAGIAIALTDVLKNLAGWIYILSRRPFWLGDRIEVDGTKGDVIDIRLFRFSLMEIGGWVDAEQSTGRMMHVPNGIVFTSKVANYTEGFAYIWHELPVLVTLESDHRRARKIIEDALERHAPDVDRTAGDRLRENARNYHIRIGALTPTVYLTVRDSGILLTARYLTGVRQRRNIEQAVWTHILDAIEDDPSVELAYPTVRTFFEGPIGITQVPPEDPGGI